MRGAAPWVLVILGLCATTTGLLANEPPAIVQPEEGPFAEEIRQLEAAADKAARRDAFAAVIARARALKREPEPLLSILRNRKPEAAFADLLGWIRDTEPARHPALLPSLIAAANEAGESAKQAAAAVKAYGTEALDTLCTMLAAESEAERAAAAVVAAERPGGLRGAARLTPHLVRLAAEAGPELRAQAISGLKKLTLLNFETVPEWQAWLKGKTSADLIIEIGDREAETRRITEERANELERELRQAYIERMRSEEAQNPAALASRLRTSNHAAIRLEAAKLLAALLPTLPDDTARAPMEDLGALLNDTTQPEDVRRACAAALADSRKPGLAYPHFDRALEINGLSADLRLELVKGLNSPIAAGRLAQVLKSEIDQATQRSGAVLLEAIKLVGSVLEREDAGPNRDVLLAELSRLLYIVQGQLGASPEEPARRRYVEIAQKACESLTHLARLRGIDISACVGALLGLLQTDNGSANAALTTVRQAVVVPAAREPLRARLTTPPESELVSAAYARAAAAGDEPQMLGLLELCETIALLPEPLDQLRERLLSRARQSEAQLPSGPDARRTVRDLLRSVLARLQDNDLHALTLQLLLDCEFGERDALAYVLLLRPSRAMLVQAALTPKLNLQPLRVGRLAAELASALTPDEIGSPEFAALRAAAATAVRGEFGARIDRAIKQGMNEEERARLTAQGSGNLREHFVPAAIEKLREHTTPGDNRDAAADLLLAVLRAAHPEKYAQFSLKGLAAAEFEQQLEALKARARLDGYTIP